MAPDVPAHLLLIAWFPAVMLPPMLSASTSAICAAFWYSFSASIRLLPV